MFHNERKNTLYLIATHALKCSNSNASVAFSNRNGSFSGSRSSLIDEEINFYGFNNCISVLVNIKANTIDRH